MAESIVQVETTAIPGVELIYLEDRDSAGIHLRGLARLLNCQPSTVENALTSVQEGDVIEAEIQTERGMRTVQFILEPGVIQILETIMDGRHKAETKKIARELYRRFAIAGFKLYAMLQAAPQQLKAQVDRHVEELTLRKEILALEIESAKVSAALLDKRHYIVTALPEPVQQKILGYKEVKVTEYVDRTIAPDGSVSDGVGITYIQKRYGFKNTKEAWAWLERIGMGRLSDKWQHQLKAVESSVLPREYLDELDIMYGESPRQRWLGE